MLTGSGDPLSDYTPEALEAQRAVLRPDLLSSEFSFDPDLAPFVAASVPSAPAAPPPFNLAASGGAVVCGA